MKKNTSSFHIHNQCIYNTPCLYIPVTVRILVGQVDLIPGQMNFAQPLAQGQVLQKIICQPLQGDVEDLF
jgi:hypothetical protein